MTIFSSSDWNSVIGLEVHAQISSSSKLFSSSGSEFGAPVNSQVSLFDAATPGTLPVLNRHCVEAAIRTSLALSCEINPVSLFDRKHYFYADMPAGYQITQQRLPLAKDGQLEFTVFRPGIRHVPYRKVSKLKQLQLEQDSGKSLHDEDGKRSLIDLNRAGISLMELVFEPDLSDGEEAACLIKELSLILRRLGTCSCRMDEGSLRVDANVSVNRPGEPLGVRTEIKNLNSIRSVARAIASEISRQVTLLEAGKSVVNETRGYDSITRQTVSMRDKEEKQDYRYMPEPNLPPLRLRVNKGSTPVGVKSGEQLIDVESLGRTLPELPAETRQHLRDKYNLSWEMSSILMNAEGMLALFLGVMENESRDPRLVTNILVTEVLELLNKRSDDVTSSSLNAAHVGEVVDLLSSKTISLSTVSEILAELLDGNAQSPIQMVVERNWRQLTDKDELQKICEDVLEQNPKIVEQYLSGKAKVFNALVGQVAKRTSSRADMAAANTIMKELLSRKR